MCCCEHKITFAHAPAPVAAALRCCINFLKGLSHMSRDASCSATLLEKKKQSVISTLKRNQGGRLPVDACMGFVWVHVESFLHSVASSFHSFVSSYKRVKGRSHTVEKRKASHPQKLHATSQPSRFSHTPSFVSTLARDVLVLVSPRSMSCVAVREN